MAATTLWSDQEKLALVLSVATTTNSTIDWKGIPLPKGRTLESAKKMYRRLLESAADVPMAGCGGAVQPLKRPRGPNKKQRVKKEEVAVKKEAEVESNEEEDGELGHDCKRVKFENEIVEGVADEELLREN